MSSSRKREILKQARDFLRAGDRAAVSLYRLIEEESQRQPVSRLCRTLGVTRSGFYDYRRQPLSDRALADWLLSEQIRAIFDESEQTYGSPRVFKELKLGRGMQIAEKRVARLMR